MDKLTKQSLLSRLEGMGEYSGNDLQVILDELTNIIGQLVESMPEEETQTDEVENIKDIISVQKFNDVIVVTSEQKYPLNVSDIVYNKLKKAFPDNEVVMLPGGMKIDVLRKEE